MSLDKQSCALLGLLQTLTNSTRLLLLLQQLLSTLHLATVLSACLLRPDPRDA
jgi:hypothetical protein